MFEKHLSPPTHPPPFLKTGPLNTRTWQPISQMEDTPDTHPSSKPPLPNQPINFIQISQQIGPKVVSKSTGSSSSWHKLTVKLPIDCHSNKDRNFVAQLVNALTQSPYFQYLARLSPPTPLPTQPCIEHQHLYTHSITYCVFQNVDDDRGPHAQVEGQFRSKAEKTHQMIVALKGKYRLQTRLSFWVKRFNELLRQLEGKEVQELGQLKLKSPSLSDMDIEQSIDEIPAQMGQVVFKRQ